MGVLLAALTSNTIFTNNTQTKVLQDIRQIQSEARDASWCIAWPKDEACGEEPMLIDVSGTLPEWAKGLKVEQCFEDGSCRTTTLQEAKEYYAQ